MPKGKVRKTAIRRKARKKDSLNPNPKSESPRIFAYRCSSDGRSWIAFGFLRRTPPAFLRDWTEKYDSKRRWWFQTIRVGDTQPGPGVPHNAKLGLYACYDDSWLSPDSQGPAVFLSSKVAVELLAQRERYEQLNPEIRARKEDEARAKLPCAERGYHVCDCCGERVTPEQITADEYARGFCRDCEIDLHPSRSAQGLDAALYSRCLAAAHESAYLAAREAGAL